MLIVEDSWRDAFDDSRVGVIAMKNVSNPKNNDNLNKKKRELESDLRTLFNDKSQIISEPIVSAYRSFYKRFKKSYHVLGQLESVALKGKSIPDVNALVECMFMAELRNMLLTAGHDLDHIEGELRLSCSKGGETFVNIRGEERELKPGDMFISDSKGIISSVIYGPDKRTMIRDNTTRVLYTTYAPDSVPSQAVEQHLHGIERNVLTVCPDASTIFLGIATSK
jgi:DNA/RNA-binding domain of Phe-tRNA-synthetase-like protein